MIIIVRRLLLAVVAVLASCGPASDSRGDADGRLPEDGDRATPAAPAQPAAGEEGEEGPVVVFLGTSLTAGLGLAGPEEGYVARVDALADSAGAPIRAVNAGVSGETSAGGLRRLDWILRRPVDVLVVELGANDGLRGQDPAALEENLATIIRRTRTRYPGTPVLIAGMEAPPNLGPAYTDAFRAVFPRVAEETGAGLVPFLLEGVAGVPELNQPDGIHPTPRGHARMAETLWPHLEPLVRSVEGAGAGSEHPGAGSEGGP